MPDLDPELDPELVRRGARLVMGDQFGALQRMQRRLGVDYDTATAVMNLLEWFGVVGPERLGLSREVLRLPDELDDVLAEITHRLEPPDTGDDP